MAPRKKASKTEFIPVSVSQIKQLGAAMMGHDPEGQSEAIFRTRFLSFFGVNPAVVVETWDLIEVPFIHYGDFSHAKPHLLWALLFLKKYGDETEMAALCGAEKGAVDEKTFRKWSHIFVKRIASLKYNVVSFHFIALILCPSPCYASC